MIGVVKANRHGDSCGWCCIWHFNCFFVFVRAEKTKKRCSEGARARDGGGSRLELVPVVVQLVTGRGIGGGRAAAGLEVVPVVLVVVFGTLLIKV